MYYFPSSLILHALTDAPSGLARRRLVLDCWRESHLASPLQASLAHQNTRIPQRRPARVSCLAVERRGGIQQTVCLCGRRSDIHVRPCACRTQLWRAARCTCVRWRAERRAGRHRTRVPVNPYPPPLIETKKMYKRLSRATYKLWLWIHLYCRVQARPPRSRQMLVPSCFAGGAACTLQRRLESLDRLYDLV